jgi:hypothetical protein
MGPSVSAILVCGVTSQRHPGDHRVFQPLADHGVRSMEIAARKSFFKRGCAGGYAVEFDFRASRGARNLQTLRQGRSGQTNQ